MQICRPIIVVCTLILALCVVTDVSAQICGRRFCNPCGGRLGIFHRHHANPSCDDCCPPQCETGVCGSCEITWSGGQYVGSECGKPSCICKIPVVLEIASPSDGDCQNGPPTVTAKTFRLQIQLGSSTRTLHFFRTQNLWGSDATMPSITFYDSGGSSGPAWRIGVFFDDTAAGSAGWTGDAPGNINDPHKTATITFNGGSIGPIGHYPPVMAAENQRIYTFEHFVVTITRLF